MRADIIQASQHPAPAGDAEPPWTGPEFEIQLRERGRSYHIHHPFNVMLNTGLASPEQVRGWVANRFYYQIAIPIKDAAVLSNCPDSQVRRGWVQRILDHDGFELGGIKDAGGIEAWLRLAEAVGLTRAEVLDLRHVVPAMRYAVDAYVNFARRAPWQEAVCSSLTELFAPEIHKQRLATWPEHYGWIESDGPQPGEPGTARCRARPGRHAGALRHPPPATPRPGGAAVQARHPLGHERCDGPALWRGEGMSSRAAPRANTGVRSMKARQ
jgi:pyrroloquinoline-quinone synthase